MFSTQVILKELLSFYNGQELAEKIGISAEELISESNKGSNSSFVDKLKAAWDAHVLANLKQMTMRDFVDAAKSGKTLMVDTPDGPQYVPTVFEKKPRNLVKINTVGHQLVCSDDHLIETSVGWVFAKDVTALEVITSSGLQHAAVEQTGRVEPVWDFEVAHDNHRYWGGTGISSHNSGKSFILSNIVKNAQAQGAFVVMLDSEHALDIGYLKKIGVNVDPDNFLYAGVTTFADVVKVISEFVTSYEKTYGRDNPDSPPVVIALDSIDMLITDSENDHFQAGVQKGDQGQRAKQSKHMLRTIVSRIKRNPMTFLVTHQVYPNPDLMNGQGLWIVNNAIRYSASQIMLIVPAKLKDGSDIIGVRMKVETYKSRFAQVGTKVEVEVPYASGMNKYSGFLDMMEDLGVVKASGAWKSLELPGKEVKKFQTKHLNEELVAMIMSHPSVTQSEKSVLELMADETSYADENAEISKLEE